jgi:Mg-chelatase subunit ChlD
VKELAADIYFLGDSSNSIASPGWQKELNFITKVTEAFRLGPDDVQVGFGIFSTNFKHIFNLDGYTDQAALARAVLSTTQLKSNTYTFDALDAVNNNGYLTNPAFGGGRNVPKILIVITDGQSQDIARTIQAASNLRKNNITIFSVGVGLTNAIELQGIAGNAGNVFSVRTFALLDTIRGEITQSVCYAPIPPQVKACPEAGLHDLIFVVDSVNTLGTANVDRSLLLISSILNAFTVDENNVKVSVVMSDKTPRVLFNLTSSLQVFYESLAAVTNLNINTHTYTGLLYAADFFTPENGAREGATKTIVLLSDGKSSDPLSVIADAEHVKTRGINVVTLGILPEADLKELSGIASKPQNNIQARNYISLPSSANQVAQAACRGS